MEAIASTFSAVNTTLTDTLGLPLWVPGKLENPDFVGTYKNEWDSVYYEFWMQSPFLKKILLITPYEENPTHLLRLYDWMTQHPEVPVVAVILYVIAVFGGQKLMKNREAFDFRKALSWWNIFLSVFSFIGVIRVVPEIIYKYFLLGEHEIMCGHPETIYGSGAVGTWVQLFILSKLGELIDTAFLVLHKRPVIFLHWYHHVTVLLFCWFTYVYKNPGVLFCGMNYSVHAIMYFYYYLQSADRFSLLYTHILPMFGYKKDKGSCKDSFKISFLSKKNTSRITMMQTSQMVVGVLIVIYYYLHPSCSTDEGGPVDWTLMAYCGVMYASYLYLFAEVYIDKFLKKKDPKQASKEVAEQGANPNVPPTNEDTKKTK